MNFLIISACITLFKFIFVYLAIGTAAIMLIFISFALSELICSGVPLGVWVSRLDAYGTKEFIDIFQQRLLNNLPFADIFDKIADDSGGYFTLITGFLKGNFADVDISAPQLFDSVVILIIANLLIHIFCRTNVALSGIFSGFAFSVGMFVGMGIFGIAGFSIASDILRVVDFYSGENRVLSYIAVAALCFLIHMIFLMMTQISVPTIFKYLAKNIVIGVVNSVLIFEICMHLQGVYAYDQMLAFLIAFFTFTLFLVIEKEFLK